MVAGSGLAALVALSVASALDTPGLTVSFSPLAVPALPVLPIVGTLVALLPVLVSPAPRPAAGPAEPASSPSLVAREDVLSA
jgi:energy-coupling factor transport system permease protein